MSEFKYRDKVYYMEYDNKIKSGLFSEYWDGLMSYIDGNKIIDTNSLYPSMSLLIKSEIEKLKQRKISNIKEIEKLQEANKNIPEKIVEFEKMLMKI